MQLLKACGMEELAKHAQQRLTELFALSAVLTQEASEDLKPAEERWVCGTPESHGRDLYNPCQLRCARSCCILLEE